MVVIATGDEFAVDLLAPAALRVAHPRPVVIEIMDRKVLGFPDDAAAAMTQEVVGPGAVRGDCNRIYTSGPTLGPEGLHAASHVH